MTRSATITPPAAPATSGGLLVEIVTDAYPEIEGRLDTERTAAAVPPIDAGIREVAEAA